jgi:hypothetical protein
MAYAGQRRPFFFILGSPKIMTDDADL